MALQAAIEHWHALLTDELAEETQARLDSQLAYRGLFFGNRPLCSVLRPRFLTAAQYAFLQSRCSVLMGAFRKAYEAAIEDESVLAQFGLDDWEIELLARPTPASATPVRCRGWMRSSCPTAVACASPSTMRRRRRPPAYNDVLAEVFLGLPVMGEFLRRYEVRPQPSRQNVMHALLDAWHQWSGRRAAPRIAILDWHDVPTYSEFVITAEYLRSQGLDCVIADPREVGVPAGDG